MRRTGRWQATARQRWPKAWIGGSGPVACVVKYVKHVTVTLFKNENYANTFKETLDSLEPTKKRWIQTEVVDLETSRAAHAR